MSSVDESAASVARDPTDQPRGAPLERELLEALRFYACECVEGSCETGSPEDVACGFTARAAIAKSEAQA